MQTRVRVPARRVMGLAITETDNEVLIYDTERHHIHHLNATTSAVWRACDGTHGLDEIARLASVTLGDRLDEATVRLALTKLDDANLLADPLPTDLRAARLSRRTLMRRAAIAGAIAVPAIVSTTAPTAAGANTKYTCDYGCTTVGDCNPPGGGNGPCPDCSGPMGQNGICVKLSCPTSCTYASPCSNKSTTCLYCVNGVCQSTAACGLACNVGDNASSTDYTNQYCKSNAGGSANCKYCVGGFCTTTQPRIMIPGNATNLAQSADIQSPSPTLTPEPPTPTPTEAPPTDTPTPEPPTPTPTDVPPTPTPTDMPVQDVVTTDQTQQDVAPGGTPDSSD